MNNIEEVKKIIARWHGEESPCRICSAIAEEICQLKDAECQQRVERIFREIDSIYHLGRNHSNDCYGVIQPSPNCLACKWQALKKREGIG